MHETEADLSLVSVFNFDFNFSFVSISNFSVAFFDLVVFIFVFVFGFDFVCGTRARLCSWQTHRILACAGASLSTPALPTLNVASSRCSRTLILPITPVLGLRQTIRRTSEEPMAWDLVLWLICFFAVVSLLGILVYQLMCLSDLEFDYINPFDSASRINSFIIPEFAIHGGLGCVYLLTGHWLLCLLNVPLTYYHTNLYLKKQHLLDVTEIFNLLDREKKYRLVKLAFYLLLFFIVIYKLLVTAVYLILEHEDGVEPGSFTGIHSDF